MFLKQYLFSLHLATSQGLIASDAAHSSQREVGLADEAFQRGWGGAVFIPFYYLLRGRSGD